MFSLVVLLTAALQGAPASHNIADMRWMAGCWTLSSGKRVVTEFWLPPDGGTMLGLSRTISGGQTVEYEFLLIRVGRDAIEYVAKPSGQPEAVFTATRVVAGESVFENPKHDFPTKITYRRTDGGLLATIEGKQDGKLRAIDFRYVAGMCPK